MTEQDPTVEELQKTVTQLTAERDKLATDLKAAQSYKTQFDELKTKYDSVVQTNMDLIRHIPMDGGHDQAKTGTKDLKDMDDKERYAYLKEMAVKSFEKTKA
jgi:hypothetical protein